MTCTLIALAIVCSGPSVRTSPEKAAAILGPPPAIYVARQPEPPRIVATEAPSVRDFPPTTRGPLDGSSYTPGPWRMVAPRDRVVDIRIRK